MWDDIKFEWGNPGSRGGRLRLLSALVLSTMLLVAACGGSGGSSSSSDVTLNVEASPSGPLTDNFNPFYNSSAINLVGGTSMIYEPLLQYNIMKPGQTYPWLATSHTWSDGGKTLTFQIRSGVKWSDGKAFSANDVAFTFNLLKKYPAINTEAITFGSITAPNATQVVIKFPTPSYNELYYIASTYIVPQHIWQSAGDPSAYTAENPVGTGPYMLQSYSSQGFHLKRNPHYWQPGLPKVNALYYPVYDSNTSANLALIQGSLDWAGNSMPQIKQRYVGKDPKNHHYEITATHTDYLIPNVDHYPLNMVAVRKAIELAVDRQALSLQGTDGYNPPVSSPTLLPLPLFKSYLAPQYQNLRLKTDDQEATSLLKSAGFKMTPSGIFQMPNGQPFELKFMAVTAYTEQITEGQLIVSDLKKIGIDASVQGVSLQAALADTASGNFDLSINGSNVSPQPYDLYEQMLDSSLSAPIGQNAVGDLGRFDSSEMDQLLAQLRGAGTRQEEQTALNGIESIVVNQVPVIPTVYGVNFCEYSSAKVTGWPTLSNPYALPTPSSPFSEITVLRLRPKG